LQGTPSRDHEVTLCLTPQKKSPDPDPLGGGKGFPFFCRDILSRDHEVTLCLTPQKKSPNSDFSVAVRDSISFTRISHDFKMFVTLNSSLKKII
jgi:hypothetical protein